MFNFLHPLSVVSRKPVAEMTFRHKMPADARQTVLVAKTAQQRGQAATAMPSQTNHKKGDADGYLA